MRVVIAILMVCCLYAPVLAVDSYVYPPESPVTFSCVVLRDTVTVTLRGDGLLPVMDVYIAEHTINAPKLIRCTVDGAIYGGVVMEIDSVFQGVRTTRWMVSQFTRELQLVYYVSNYYNSMVNWVAFHEGPVFGVVSDPACCRGNTGNVNNDLLDATDLADLSTLIGYMTGLPYNLNCPKEANIDRDPAGIVDLSDLSLLIGHLTARRTLPACP